VTSKRTQDSRQFRYTGHALFEMKRRGLGIEAVDLVLAHPGQVLDLRPGRAVYQSIMVLDDSQNKYLIRVIVDIDRIPFDIVTVYKTSKISKYWKAET
jgi:hypothetical protein